MASDITIKKEKDVLPMPAALKKTSVIPRRSRFIKPQPNIGSVANKLPKDIKTCEPKSKVEDKPDLIDHNLEPESSQVLLTDLQLQESKREPECNDEPAVKIVEPEILNPSTAPGKQSVIPISAARSRFQKARPNIFGLAKKAPKSNPIQEERSPISSTSETLTKEINSEVAKNAQEIEPSAFILPVTKKNVSFSFAHGIVEVPASKDDSDSQEVASFQEQNVTNPEDIQSIEFEEPPLSISQPAISDDDTHKDPVTANKSLEYPTLKSILNSPRKRALPKKVHEKKRRLANLSANPSRSEMTMTDLIYWNPTTSPMKTAKVQIVPVENLPSDENLEPPPAPEELQAAEEEEVGEEESSSAPVPKVIINEDGEIILDESSLVVRRKETIDKTIEPIIENENTTYSSFRKRSAKQWANKETAKFYKALSLVGTDFALMESIFTVDGKVTRSRRELKLKFKREEKQHTELVHRAMYESQTYDVSILDDEVEDSSEMSQDVDSPPKRGRKRTLNKPRGKRRVETDTTDTEEILGDLCPENDLTQEIEVSLACELASEWHAVNAPEMPEISNIASLNGRRSSVVYSAEDSEADIVTELDIETSRSGRIRKNKVMPDFITLEDSDDSNDESMEITMDADFVHSFSSEKNSSDKERPEVVSLYSQDMDIGNLLKVPDTDSIGQGNLLTDAEISEVVTSDKPPTKRARKKTVPNLCTKRHEFQLKPKSAQQPSFMTFTPTEELHFVPETNPRTYSRTNASTRSDPFPVVSEEVIRQGFMSPLHGNAVQTNDDAPIMIMTRSPHNENILHLFMVNSPSQ